MAEGARHSRPDAEREAFAVSEIPEEYLGDISARLFDLQAERARLEGTDATAKELKAVEKEIAALQAFVDEHQKDYDRMSMRVEKAREAEIIPLIRKKAKNLPTAEAPQTLSADLQDLQKHYDLTAEQLTSETDPEARAALENSIDHLRERIHTLKADIPWEKEDRVLATGGIKRSSTARLEGREGAKEHFEAAEIDRAGLIDLRNTYSQSLESGSLPKGGEILLRGAVQTLDDALAKYGRGNMSADAFQSRVSEISKARKMWDRYVKDESVAIQRTQEKERAAAEKTREAENAPFRQHGKTNGVDYAVGWVGGKEKRYEAFFPQVKYDTPEAKKYNIHNQIFVIDSTDKAHAKEVFDKIGEILKKEKNPYRAYAKAEAFERGVAWEEPGAQEFRDMVEKAKEKRDASRAEVRGILEGLAKEREEHETNKDRQIAGDLVGAMEAGPDTTVHEEVAPPPENLPVAPERHATREDISAKMALYKGYTKQGRSGMYWIVKTAASNMAALNARERAMVVSQYPEWTAEDFRDLHKELDRANREQEAARKFRAEAHTKVDELVQGSIDRTNAKIDALRGKIHAEQERIRVKKNELRPGEEERFFAQGEKTEELAKREQAIENFPNLTPDEAATAQEKIEAKSARDFENEEDFTAAFLKAAEQDPSHRIDMGHADEYVKQYWNLLTKDNARLTEAMKPQPKVGFFKRLFGGGSKPKETMTAQEIVQFQKMDQVVRKIMETPMTSFRSIRFRAGTGKTESTPGSLYTGRGPQ